MNPFSRRDWKRKARSTWQDGSSPDKPQQELSSQQLFIILAIIVVVALILRSFF